MPDCKTCGHPNWAHSGAFQKKCYAVNQKLLREYETTTAAGRAYVKESEEVSDCECLDFK